jgi:hypothetical protein
MPLKIKNMVWLVIFLHLFANSCKDNTKHPEAESTPSIDKSFLAFYEQYSKDSLFQLEHTVFPLEGMKARHDENDMIDPDFRWTQENWVFQKEFDDLNGSFTREFYNLNGVIVEKIADKSGNFTMERRFGKLSSGWHLIYYREMGMNGK